MCFYIYWRLSHSIVVLLSHTINHVACCVSPLAAMSLSVCRVGQPRLHGLGGEEDSNSAPAHFRVRHAGRGWRHVRGGGQRRLGHRGEWIPGPGQATPPGGRHLRLLTLYAALCFQASFASSLDTGFWRDRRQMCIKDKLLKIVFNFSFFTFGILSLVWPFDKLSYVVPGQLGLLPFQINYCNDRAIDI